VPVEGRGCGMIKAMMIAGVLLAGAIVLIGLIACMDEE